MLYLDSANLDDVAAAAALGVVAGVTTNPRLMREHTTDPIGHLGRIVELFRSGWLMYQPTAVDPVAAEREARAAVALAPGRVVVKLLARLDFVGLAARLSAAGVPCALTAVFAPGQAILAHQSACRWVIPYVDRATREGRDAHEMIGALATVLRNLGGRTAILAASLKSPEQAVQAIHSGAQCVSVPRAVLEALAGDPLTESAVAQFAAGWANAPAATPGHVQAPS